MKKAGILFAILWLAGIFIFALQQAKGSTSVAGLYSARFDYVEFLTILVGVGVVPIVIAWGIVWVASSKK